MGIELDKCPGVTIVIPVLNAERTLEQCIEGIFSQEYPRGKYEAIFVDNGSRDTSLAILEKYKDKIFILMEKKRGAAAARNTGIRHAKYEYIAFIDSDCVPKTTWLRELVICALSNTQADFIGGKIISFNRNSSIEIFGEEIFNHKLAIQYYKPPSIITANALMKRQRLFHMGLFDEAFLRCQDAELAYRGYFRYNSQFVYTDKAIVSHFNSNTLMALFFEGVQHGKGAAHIWKRYSKQIGRSLLSRCVDFKEYTAIMYYFVLYFMQIIRIRRIFNEHKLSEEELKRPLYKAVFNLGKKIGFVFRSIRYIWYKV
jgi:glycosyltransferase involved in cell wall biosynthesis